MEAMQSRRIDLNAYTAGLSATPFLVARKQDQACSSTLTFKFNRCLDVAFFSSSITFGIAGLVYTKTYEYECIAD
jgi:hypothetical protein